MYWALPTYVLGAEFAAVVAGEVLAVRTETPGNPELRGPGPIHFATLRIERVFRQGPPKRLPKGPPLPSLIGRKRIEVEGADGVAVGDKLVVFIESYDGGYGIVPKRGTETPVGIRVGAWTDPIVPAIERWLAGDADWSKPEEVEPWRPYGEAVIRCIREGTPVSQCGND